MVAPWAIKMSYRDVPVMRPSAPRIVTGDDGVQVNDEGVKHDPVNHPSHYTAHPSGVECIQITEHMNFCRGNAVKYIWRAGEKGNDIEDWEKARWYLDREIARMKKAGQ
jgi:hypothetical protein